MKLFAADEFDIATCADALMLLETAKTHIGGDVVRAVVPSGWVQLSEQSWIELSGLPAGRAKKAFALLQTLKIVEMQPLIDSVSGSVIPIAKIDWSYLKSELAPLARRCEWLFGEVAEPDFIRLFRTVFST